LNSLDTISAYEIKLLSVKDRKLLYEIISQQMTLFALDKVMTFPDDILLGCSKSTLGCNMIKYLAGTGFLFPHTMRDQLH
jgi:hypothetical protein